jgi:hypothetical protein
LLEGLQTKFHDFHTHPWFSFVGGPGQDRVLRYEIPYTYIILMHKVKNNNVF